MTVEQKQALLDFLGDWCLYNDWNSLIAIFPNQRFRFAVLTQAVIMKDIFQSLVENPFYYIDLGTHWDGFSETLPPTYGKELYQHWQKLLRVDELIAEKWRFVTVQMMNRYLEPHAGPETDPICSVEAWDCTTGIRSWNIRQRYVNQLVRNILDRSSLIWPMLLDHDPKKELETEEPFRREGLLRRCYEEACDFAVQIRCQKRWWAHGQDGYDTPFDYAADDFQKGRRSAIIFWPTTWAVSCRYITVPPQGSMIAQEGGRSSLEGIEWAYADERDWVYKVFACGRVYLAGRGQVKPDDASRE
ncbi:hypothetical protein N7493_011602 [Penicillium malachiteum]|uniref:Uncharacterized protein n=1 Tax=Penicillium malachiteum TaxID=1324776 RepID=A0AAD6HB37_9EURO|nr:hypothetical protein N7493_011602 [Penicillium malachiteum]